MVADVAERLGELLRELGFGGDRDRSLRTFPGGVPPPQMLSSLGRDEDARLSTLLGLFIDVNTMRRADVEHALGPLTLEELSEAALVDVEGEGVRARIALRAVEGLIVAGDPWRDQTEPAFVGNASRSTEHTAALAIRRPAASALDLGTGSGLLALIASRHADRAVGVDVNPRALRFARLNQRLNGIENVSWMEGNWFDPVANERFDLVLANLPYAISPDTMLVYRDSPSEADEQARRLIRETSVHIAEGGFATVMCDWIHAEDDWEGPLREWVTGLECDVLMLHFESYTPLLYAMMWNSGGVARDAASFTEAVNRWVGHFERLGVERIGTGALVLRRRSGGSNWTRGVQLAGAPTSAGGDQLQRVFAGCHYLETQPPGAGSQQLMSTAWRLVDGHRLNQTLVYQEGGYASGDAVMRQDSSLNLLAEVSMRVVPVLTRCDGRHVLGQLIAESPVPPGLDRGSFYQLCIGTVKDLIARGFLVGGPLHGG